MLLLSWCRMCFVLISMAARGWTDTAVPSLQLSMLQTQDLENALMYEGVRQSHKARFQAPPAWKAADGRESGIERFVALGCLVNMVCASLLVRDLGTLRRFRFWKTLLKKTQIAAGVSNWGSSLQTSTAKS